MKNFLNSSNPNVSNRQGKRWLLCAILVLALIGLADATYLTVTHYAGRAVSCSVLHGCEQVLTSKYATVSGIPIAVFGVVYYVGLFLLAYYRLLGNRFAGRLLQLAVAAGIIVTSVLMYLQLGVIQAVCQYCILSAILTTIIAILVVLLALRNKTDENSLPAKS